jgi:hypothetical protein
MMWVLRVKQRALPRTHLRAGDAQLEYEASFFDACLQRTELGLGKPARAVDQLQQNRLELAEQVGQDR